MKNIIQMIICSVIILIAGCKQKPAEQKPAGNNTGNQVIHNEESAKPDESSIAENPNVSADKSALMPSFVPASGKSNWAAEFDDKKEHAVGIFRLPDERSWRELIAQMDYAPESELKNSFIYEPYIEWWAKRDVKTNVLQKKLLAYKKSDKTGTWYFAFNKNKEVYFWK